MGTEIGSHIERTPGVCGGKPRIAGRRIRVQDIAVWHEYLGMSADEIVAEYPDLTLAEVHAALAFYYDHRAEIQDHIRRGEDLATQVRTQTPSKLIGRFTGDGDGDSIPPG